jgi:hypothetical protein
MNDPENKSTEQTTKAHAPTKRRKTGTTTVINSGVIRRGRPKKVLPVVRMGRPTKELVQATAVSARSTRHAVLVGIMNDLLRNSEQKTDIISALAKVLEYNSQA